MAVTKKVDYCLDAARLQKPRRPGSILFVRTFFCNLLTNLLWGHLVLKARDNTFCTMVAQSGIRTARNIGGGCMNLRVVSQCMTLQKSGNQDLSRGFSAIGRSWQNSEPYTLSSKL